MRILALAAAICCLLFWSHATACAAAVEGATKDRIIAELESQLRAQYIFADKGALAAEALIRAQRSGKFAKVNDGAALAAALTATANEVLHDQHFKVEYNIEAEAEHAADAPPTAAGYERYKHFVAQRDNFGLRRVEQLDGNVGYLAIQGFPDASLMAQPLAAAMQFLSNTDALIIDLRTNHGGDPLSVALVESYFFAPWSQQHVNDVFTRHGSSGTTKQYWTSPVPGPLYLQKPVFILTSSTTISAGEGLAYEMQALKRATIIGEKTAGAANPDMPIWLDPHFDVLMPASRAINPLTGTNWEGTGVQPDVRVASDDALKDALVRALRELKK